MSDSGPGRREVAYRLLAAEFDDAEFSYSESDEERAPNYVVTPTGARVNRLFAVGVLTEVEDVNPEMVRGRVVDPTGAFVTYAGQYQPDALAFLERADPPTFVALSGKARTFEPDDGDRIYTSVRPESVSEVDAETRDRAAVVAAERTLDRVGVMASAIESGLEGDRLRAALAEAGVDERLADGVALALEYYGTTPAYLEALRELALDVARVVAGEREEVRSLDAAPGEGTGDAAALASLDLSDVSIPESATQSGAETTDGSEATATATEGGDREGVDAGVGDGDEPAADVGEQDDAASGSPTAESPTTADPDVDTDTGTATGTRAATGAEPDETSTGAAEPDAGAVSGTDPAPADPDETVPEGTPDAGTEAGSSDEVDEPGDFDPGEYELDEEERRAVEEEHGTEFSTADEIEDADGGSPDPEVAADEGSGAAAEPEPDAEQAAEPESHEGGESEPESEPAAEPESHEGGESEPESEPAAEPETETEPAPGSETAAGPEEGAEAAGDVDLEDAVVRTMEELDDGDGADHDEVVASVVDEHGADPDDVEDAVQDALMSGRCYEPADGTLKSI